LETSCLDELDANWESLARCNLSLAVLRNKLWKNLTSLLSVTVVDSALVSVFTNSLGLNNSSDSITALDDATIRFSQLDCNVMAVTSLTITRVFSTCIVVVTRFDSMLAFSVTARVNGALVSIVAFLFLVDTSEDSIARINGAFISIVARNWSVDASGCLVARINSAGITVVADLWLMNTLVV
jgi:hypothetical protein